MKAFKISHSAQVVMKSVEFVYLIQKRVLENPGEPLGRGCHPYLTPQARVYIECQDTTRSYQLVAKFIKMMCEKWFSCIEVSGIQQDQVELSYVVGGLPSDPRGRILVNYLDPRVCMCLHKISHSASTNGQMSVTS